jgi:glycosyltransferase involved in cell wall biosynthesis
MQKNKIKVLLVSPYSKKKVGGIGTWSKNIIDYVRENNEDVNLKFQNTAVWFKSNLEPNILMHLLIGIIDTSFIIIRLFFNLLSFKPDVVHYTSSAAFALYKDNLALFIVKKIFKKRFIIHWHFGRIPVLVRKKNREFKLLLNVIRHSTISIVIDLESYNSLRKLGIKNVVFIPNPISERLKQFALLPKLTNVIEQGTVVFVGHIIKTKGVFELVNVCSMSNVVKKLLMIGPVTDKVKNHLLNIATTNNKTNKIEFKGELKREDVFPFLKSANLICLPSYSEGFPNVLLEAMAIGCPIVATSVGAIPYMLADGVGLCIELKNNEQLKKAIEKVILDKEFANNMIIKSKNKVLSEYTLDIVLPQYYNLWIK